MTNQEMIQKFLQICKSEKNLSSKTLKAYSCDIKQFLKIIGKKDFAKVTVEDLRGFLNKMGRRSLADSTIKRKLATIKVFFRFLVDDDIIKISPTLKLKNKFKTAKRLPKVMSTLEIKGILETAHQLVSNETTHQSDYQSFKRTRDCAMLELLFVTGIRSEELVSIGLFDIDLVEKSVVIHGKGRKERKLYISSDEVILIIKQYLKYRNQLDTSTKALFLNKYKRPLGVQSLRSIFSEYCQKAGVERKFTPHCLRHTMATMLLENGADIRSVQEILGHSRISTTEIYLEVSNRRKQEVLSKFNQRNFFHLT